MDIGQAVSTQQKDRKTPNSDGWNRYFDTTWWYQSIRIGSSVSIRWKSSIYSTTVEQLRISSFSWVLSAVRHLIFAQKHMHVCCAQSKAHPHYLFNVQCSFSVVNKSINYAFRTGKLDVLWTQNTNKSLIYQSFAINSIPFCILSDA